MLDIKKVKDYCAGKEPTYYVKLPDAITVAKESFTRTFIGWFLFDFAKTTSAFCATCCFVTKDSMDHNRFHFFLACIPIF